MTTETLHACLKGFPGAALELTPDGVIRASNGKLDQLVGRDLAGVPITEIIDTSSLRKWERISSLSERTNPACTWELNVVTPRSMELRTFMAIWGLGDSGDTLWLLEHSADSKLELLYGELSELHRELVDSQRQLGRERSRLARALKEAEAAIRTRNDVLAIVSHDLRNPLSTITMAAALLELPIPEEKRAEQLAIIRRSSETMNRLIGDLLDASAVDAGTLRVERSPLDVVDVLDEARRMLEQQAEKKGLRLTVEVEAGAPEVPADRHRVLQVLTNLVGNAIKFTPEGGWVTMRVAPDTRGVRLSVQDSGPGVPASDLPHIFDRFWHTSRTRRGGAGLGLSIVKGIVEAHGGTIAVENAPGGGATFWFILPLDSTGPA